MADDIAGLDRGAAALVADYLCIRKGESVLITADTLTDAVAVAAVFRAVREMQATVAVLMIAPVPFQGALADPYVPASVAAAVGTCDVWIDLTFPYLAGSHVHEQAMKGKRVRYLLGGDLGSGGISRLFGAVDMDAYYSVHEKLQALVSASTGAMARITCPYGTDVVFEIGKSPYLKPRRAENPGFYLVPGSCTIFPVLETVRGTISFTGIFHEYFSTLPAPLIVKVDGKIKQIVGPAVHKTVLDRSLRRAGNGDYGNIIHFTYGMHPAARITGQSFIEDSRVMGANAVGMGLPWWIPGGGENHPDGVISDQSIWIGAQQIVDQGQIIGPADIAALVPRLHPAVAPAH